MPSSHRMNTLYPFRLCTLWHFTWQTSTDTCAFNFSSWKRKRAFGIHAHTRIDENIASENRLRNIHILMCTLDGETRITTLFLWKLACISCSLQFLSILVAKQKAFIIFNISSLFVFRQSLVVFQYSTMAEASLNLHSVPCIEHAHTLTCNIHSGQRQGYQR